jgi:hypothetical protein
MRGDMQSWSVTHGSSSSGPVALLACASNDAGFAPALRYAASCGISTLAVTNPLKARRRQPWQLPPQNYSRYPLPAAAGCCLVWDEGWLPGEQAAAVEEGLVLQWARKLQLPEAPLPCPGGVTATWSQGQRQ